MGDAAHPPYCERHAKRCAPPGSAAAYVKRFWARGNRLPANGVDKNVPTCPENRSDFKRLAVDVLINLAAKGVFFHD